MAHINLYELTLCRNDVMALDMTIQVLEQESGLDDNYVKKPIPLTVDLFASYKQKGYKEADIARFTNQRPQNVNRFKWKNYDALQVVCDVGDNLIANKFKHSAYLDLQHGNAIIADAKESKKVSYRDSRIGAGITFEKYRLASNKATQTIDMAQVTTNRKELQQQIIDVQARIKSLKGSEIDSKGIES